MEIWKAIPGYEGEYEVSNLGKVRSLKWGKVKELKRVIHNSGYFMVNIYKIGKRKYFLVHQLVAMAFLNHKPEGMNLVVDHINKNKLDNSFENLRIITNRENCSNKFERNLPTGVCWFKCSKKYRAQIQINGKVKCLGYFLTPQEASEAYEKALAEITTANSW